MRRGIGVALAALMAFALFAVPARAESCVSSGGGPAAGQPGVVLGPATKCVRDGQASLPGSDGGVNKTGAVNPADPDSQGLSPWLALIPALVLAGGVVRAVVRRRRAASAQPQAHAA